MNNDMLCPLCKSKLYSNKTFEYEDAMCEIVNSNKWMCENPDCGCHIYNTYWNDEGEFFGGDMKYKYRNTYFPTEKYAAYNSISKKLEVECYKSGLRDKIYLSPIFMLYFLKPYIEFEYTSDFMGNILTRKFKIHFLMRDEDKKFTKLFTPYIHTLRYLNKNFMKILKSYREEKTAYNVQKLFNYFYKTNTDYRFIYKLYYKYINIVYIKTYHKVIIDKIFFDKLVLYKNITMDIGSELEKLKPNDIDLLDILIKRRCCGDYIDNRIRKEKFKILLDE